MMPIVRQVLGCGRAMVWTLAAVWLGQYPVRLLAAYPVACPVSGFGASPTSARWLSSLAFLWILIGGAFILCCVALSCAGLLVYAIRRRPMPTAWGRPAVAVASLAIAGVAASSFGLAPPERVAASWPTRAMDPLVRSIRAVCESEGACPATLDPATSALGVRTLAGRGWGYRSCGGREFAVFISQCWSSDCRLFRWTTGRCCSASTASTLAIDAEWSAMLADESETWIDALCALQP